MNAPNEITDLRVEDVVALDQHLSSYCDAIDSYRFDDYAGHFTEDGVLEVGWQDEAGALHELNGGAGCRLTGRAQIVEFVRIVFADHPPLPRRHSGPGHELVSRLIRGDGDAGTLKATHASGGFQYEIDARRTPEGWRFSRILILYGEDQPLPATRNGPTGAAAVTS